VTWILRDNSNRSRLTPSKPRAIRKFRRFCGHRVRSNALDPALVPTMRLDTTIGKPARTTKVPLQTRGALLFP